MSEFDLALLGSVYLFIGVFAGLMAGILGIGGGVIVVPGLVFVFHYTQFIPEQAIMHVAAGTSLAVMVSTAFAALLAHHKVGIILWPIFNKLWSGIVAGVISGVILAVFIPASWLKVLFALFLLFVAFKMVTNIHVSYPEQFPGVWLNRLISYIIGLQSGLLGVGGGILIIPYLTYWGIAARNIAPVSNLCSMTVGFVGAVTCMITGSMAQTAIPYATGYVYWPAVLLIAIPSSLIAPLGAKLNYVLPLSQLKYGFIVILFLTAIKMLFF